MSQWLRNISKGIVVFGLIVFGPRPMSAELPPPLSHHATSLLQTCDSLKQNASYKAIERLTIAEFSALSAEPPAQVELALNAASALMLQNRSNEALAVLNEIRKTHRQIFRSDSRLKAMLFEKYADLAIDISQIALREKAIEILSAALNEMPSPSVQRTRLYYKLGLANRLTQNKEKAIAWFSLAAQQTQTTADIQVENASEHGYCLFTLRQYPEALDKLRYAETTLKLAKVPNPEAKAQLQYYLALQVHRHADNEQATQYVDACLEVAKQFPELHTSIVSYAYSFKAQNEEIRGEYKSALKYRKLQVEHLLSNNTNSTYALASAYGRLAICYRYLDKNDLSATYWKIALNLYPKNDPAYQQSYPTKVANYAEILIHSGQLEEGLIQSNEALKFAQLYDSTNAQLFAHLLMNRAEIYKKKDRWLEAIHDLRMAVNYFEKMKPLNWHLRSMAMLNLAHCLHRADETEEANEVYEEALRSGNQHQSIDLAHTVGFIYECAAYESECLKDYPKALRSNSKVFDLVLTSDSERNPEECPNLDAYLLGGYTVENTQSRIEILRSYFLQDSDQRHLEAALACGLKALTLLRRMRQEQNVQNDKINVNKNWRSLFQLCIETAFDLHRLTHSQRYLETAFEIAEQSKAMILMSAVIENRDLNQGFENKGLLEKKKFLLSEITKVREDIMTSGSNSSKKKELLALNNDYEKVVEEIQENDPRYFELVYDFQIASPTTIQKRLAKENRALLEYFYSDSSIFIFALTKDTFFAERLNISHVFTDSINAFSNQMKYRPDAGENALSFAKNGKMIYDALWILPESCAERVTVIPDGPLSFLSFEALPIEEPIDAQVQFQDLHYLIEDHAISYNYSGTFYNYGESKIKPQNATLLAMAPTFEGYTNVKPLKETAQSIEEIRRTYPSSTTFTGLEASKANFLKYASSFDIIDLATHGIADSSNSMDSRLFFSADGTGDSILYLSELYNLKLDARLAILEACETGTGDFNQGEGVTSLARGFTYAGCKSILMSLWQVSEGNTTSNIMKSFYSNMSAGLTLDMAIAKAKRHHLQTLRKEKGSELWKIHPFFWSELVLIGEDSPIKTEQPVRASFPWPWAIAIILIIGSFGFAVFKRFRHKNKLRPKQD